jgi:hypothetical protein
MDDKEGPAVENAADTVNEAVKEISATAAQAAIGVQIDFDLPAALRKWPSRAKERVTSSIYAGPYLVFEGTLDECIGQFMSKPASQHHLYGDTHCSAVRLSKRRRVGGAYCRAGPAQRFV